MINQLAGLNLATLGTLDRNSLLLLLCQFQMDAERELSARRFKGQMSAMKRKIYMRPR